MDRYESGSSFGGYTIEGLVAGGGMGQVYAARHEVYTTPVALKVLHPRLHADPSWMKRFSVEGLVGTRLKHPNVLSARELVTHKGRIALVMDLVSGGQTLEKVISREHRSGLPLVQALKVFLAIVQGVEYLHGKAIVHGDMKPENVLIEGDFRDPSSWTPKVTDFGTVTLIADPVTIDGKPAVVATPRYAAPEHLYGIDQVEERSDIYALGLVLHFLLTGKHPSMAKSVEDAARFVRSELSVVALVDQPASLIALYRKACARDPDVRFQTARELALAVRAILDESGAGLELSDLQADLATEIDEERAQEQAKAAQGELTGETELDTGAPVGQESTTQGAAVPEAPAEPAPEPKREKAAKQRTPDGPPAKGTPEPADPPAKTSDKSDKPAKASKSSKGDKAAKAPAAPTPAEQVDPNAPTPVWLWGVIALALAFLLLVAGMSWNG